MKKIVFILATILTMCLSNIQKVGAQNVNYFQTFGWSDDDIHLYYATDTTKHWTHSRSYYGTTTTYNFNFQDPYSTVVDGGKDSCFLVFPKRWHRNWCCNSGVTFGDDGSPYWNVATGSSACSPKWQKYQKPIGVLDIPYYNVLITNSVPKYRTVTGIGERTFYGCDSLTKLTIPSTIKNIGKLFIWGCDMLDTIVFTNTFNEDVIYPPVMDDYTWFTLHPITIVVPCNSYDTFYNYISSLNTPQAVQMNIIPDVLCDCGAYVIDTVVFHDTVNVVEFVYDTVHVYDTTCIYETVVDTVVRYDTIDINVYHTYYIYDTVSVIDTVVHNVYNVYYDTILVTVFDTIIDTLTYTYEIYDTIHNIMTDTIVVTVYDTVYEIVYDTICVFVETPGVFNELRLYPVPTRDYVNVEYDGWLDYRIYNDKGKLLEIGSVVSSDRIDLTRYAAGTYYFNAKLDNGSVVTKKMIKTTL